MRVNALMCCSLHITQHTTHSQADYRTRAEWDPTAGSQSQAACLQLPSHGACPIADRAAALQGCFKLSRHHTCNHKCWVDVSMAVLYCLPVVAALLVEGCCVVLCVGNIRAGDELTNDIPHTVFRHLQPTPPCDSQHSQSLSALEICQAQYCAY